jgi:hypothetical protein
VAIIAITAMTTSSSINVNARRNQLPFYLVAADIVLGSLLSVGTEADDHKSVAFLMFKHVFMVGSSFGLLGFAGLLMQKLVAPTADDMLKFSFILFGVAVGIFAVVHQYKEEEKSLEIVF